MPQNAMEDASSGNKVAALDRLRNLLNVPPASRAPDWGNPLEKIEELLTCAICLDRYKTPKLLPCQHTFCMNCMDGLVDNLRRVMKCPECRAEHPMPYDGVKSYQTNYTLAGFLEIHFQATENNAEDLEAYIRRFNLERCKVCDEKAEVDYCSHCDKKVCLECKATHLDMIKRDLSRIMNQVKRLSNRITEASDGLSKGLDSLALNCESVKEEVKDQVRRHVKDLKKKEEHMLAEVETFHIVETRLMKGLRESLELESSNVNEACARVEAYLKGEREISDEELIRYKQMFADGLDFLRTFHLDADDLSMKKIRFVAGSEASQLSQAIALFGELQVCSPQFGGRFQQLEAQYVPRVFNLSLESDIAKNRKGKFDLSDTSPWGGQQKGNTGGKSAGNAKDRHHGGSEWRHPEDENHYSLRYRRRHQLEEEAWNRLRGERNGTPELNNRRSPRTVPNEEDEMSSSFHPEYARQHLESSPFGKVQQLTSEDTAKQNDHHHQHKTHNHHKHQQETSVQNKKLFSQVPQKTDTNAAESKKLIPQASVSVESTSANLPVPQPTPRASYARKQASTDDESLNERIDTIRKKHAERQLQNLNEAHSSQLQQVPSPVGSKLGSPVNSVQAAANATPVIVAVAKIEKVKALSDGEQENDDDDEEDEEEPEDDDEAEEEKPLEMHEIPVTLYRPPEPPSNRPVAQTAARSSAANRNTPLREKPSPSPTPSGLDWKKYLIPEPEPKPKITSTQPEIVANDRRSSSRESEDLSWSERRKRFIRSKTNPELKLSASQSKMNEAAENALGNFRNKFVESFNGDNNSGSETPKRRQSFGRQGPHEQESVDTDHPKRYPERKERSNRYRRKAERSHTTGYSSVTAASETDGEVYSGFYGRVVSHPKNPYTEKSRIYRKFGNKGAGESQFNWPRGVALLESSGEAFAVCDSSNHRVQIFDRRGGFVKTFGNYGSNKGEFDCLAGIAINKYKQFVITDRYNHRVQIFDSNGRFLREFGAHGQTNGRFNNPWGVVVDHQGFIYVCDKDNHRVQIFQADGNFVGKFGSIGNREGQFQNPHFIAVNRQNHLIVTDSSNHRVQVFDHNGHFMFNFGSEGFHEGEFKYPRGVAVDEQGFILIADSGNNRIQVFYPDGRFYTDFGSWGAGDGQLKGVEGVAVTSEGRVVVTDRENHRLQIF